MINIVDPLIHSEYLALFLSMIFTPYIAHPVLNKIPISFSLIYNTSLEHESVDISLTIQKIKCTRNIYGLKKTITTKKQLCANRKIHHIDEKRQTKSNLIQSTITKVIINESTCTTLPGHCAPRNASTHLASSAHRPPALRQGR